MINLSSFLRQQSKVRSLTPNLKWSNKLIRGLIWIDRSRSCTTVHWWSISHKVINWIELPNRSGDWFGSNTLNSLLLIVQKKIIICSTTIDQNVSLRMIDWIISIKIHWKLQSYLKPIAQYLFELIWASFVTMESIS